MTGPGPGTLVTKQTDGTVTRLTLERPQTLNALNSSLVAALKEHVDALSEHERILVIEGGERVFSSGLDLQEVASSSPTEFFLHVQHVHEMLAAVMRAPVVTVALIRGPAFGAGADLALSCDYRVVTDSARFSFPGFRLGLMLGTRRLCSLVGTDIAQTILLENRIIDATDAREIGLANATIGEDESFDRWVTDLAAKVADIPTAQIRRLKSLTRPGSTALDTALLVESLSSGHVHEAFKKFRTR